MEAVQETPDRPPLDLSALSDEAFLSANGIPRLTVVESTGSTNADLLRGVTEDPGAWPDLSVLTAEYQSAARGRLDRRWEAPARSSVSVSLVLRPVNAAGRPLPTHRYSWFSLLAALALRETLTETAGLPAELKWPNDVLVRGGKIAGILAQLGPLGGAGTPPVILGTGLNVTLTEPELPVPTATSVLLENRGHSGPDGAPEELPVPLRHPLPEFLQRRRRPRRRHGRWPVAAQDGSNTCCRPSASRSVPSSPATTRSSATPRAWTNTARSWWSTPRAMNMW